MMEWIRFIVGGLCILAGITTAAIAVYGLFKFHFAMNRMHAAATTDTLGILLVLLGLIVIRGAAWDALKLALIILFFWFASPVSSHLIAGLEVEISDRLPENCEIEEEERGGDAS